MVDINEYHFLKSLGMKHFPETMPEWAQDLTIRVCKEYGVNVPEIKWSLKNRPTSSGRAYSEQDRRENRRPYDVSITAGTILVDARMILLHELAHYTNPQGEHHGYNFWNRAFDLYEKYGIDIMYAYNRERHYRAAAEEVGARRIYERLTLRKR